MTKIFPLGEKDTPIVEPGSEMGLEIVHSLKNDRYNLVGQDATGKRWILGHFSDTNGLVLHAGNTVAGWPVDELGTLLVETKE